MEEQRVRQEERRIERITDQVKALVSLSICNALTTNRKSELFSRFLFIRKLYCPE